MYMIVDSAGIVQKKLAVITPDDVRQAIDGILSKSTYESAAMNRQQRVRDRVPS